MIGIMVMGSLALTFGLLLGYSAIRFKVEGNPIVEQVDAILPQMQCGKCGYPGCYSYAEAVVAGNADINLCTPGGETSMLTLAELLDRPPVVLGELAEIAQQKSLAVIDETLCVGCTLCIQACPVDAILGAPKHMHTVFASECTGCELCVPACPVHCIFMEQIPQATTTWKWPYPDIKRKIKLKLSETMLVES
jgi:Na+-translocating ferredoxin:NAD+ oxidoreductase subunit B